MAHLAQGEVTAHTVVQDWVEISKGLISVASRLNPERSMLGDPLTALFLYVKDFLIAQLRDGMPRQGEGFFSNPKARLEASIFGEDASAVGEAVLAYQSLF